MDHVFWKKQLIQREILSYDLVGRLVDIDWGKVFIEYEKPSGKMSDDEFATFLNVCMDEDVLSLEEDGNFALFNGSHQFVGLRSPNSSAQLFFIRLSDAKKYKKERFTRRQVPVAIFKMELAG